MIKIWKNYVTGRNDIILTGILLVSMLAICGGFLNNLWFGLFQTLIWVFAAPVVVYLMDRNNGRIKSREV